jgi:hypothetical protein
MINFASFFLIYNFIDSISDTIKYPHLLIAHYGFIILSGVVLKNYPVSNEFTIKLFDVTLK